MTKPKPLPEIETCVCGRKAYVARPLCFVGALPRVECKDADCWRGPKRKTERGAINVWNRFQRAAKVRFWFTRTGYANRLRKAAWTR